MLEHAVDIDLGTEASNIKSSLQFPENRWILYVSGPRLGPAILYWSELLALVLLAAALGRTLVAPLKTHQWLLLGLGFSTFSWSALMIVVIWLLVCGARRKYLRPLADWQYNTLQVLTAVLSIGALFSIIEVLPYGLLGTPDMHIVGNNSHGGALHWFADRSAAALPQVTVLSAPMWLYKVLILAWALWLSFAILRWLPWIWEVTTKDGYWRTGSKKSNAPEVIGES